MKLSKLSLTYSLMSILASGVCLSQEITLAPEPAPATNQAEGDTIIQL